MKPNDYARKDVLTLARILDPDAWKFIPEGGEPLEHNAWEITYKSIRTAGTVLAAGYRDCNI